MMKKCKYCGSDVFPNSLDGTYEEGYCDKLHRKAHEKILIKEGKMEGIDKGNFYVMKDSKYRDVNGELIHFPSDGRPYFDRALQTTFRSKAEKCAYLRKHNLAMDGSSDKIRMPIEAGDTRFKKVR